MTISLGLLGLIYQVLKRENPAWKFISFLSAAASNFFQNPSRIFSL
jgi:hypothetical protein